MKEKNIREYANQICKIGREEIMEGYDDESPLLKRYGLKALTGGLIQQNPLRDTNSRAGIFSKDYEEK